MRKSTFITRKIWDEIDKNLRKAILIKTNLCKFDIVNTMFVSTLESRLRECGEHELAGMLIKEEE